MALTLFVGPSTGMGLLIGLCVLAGIGVGAAHVLPWSILPASVEQAPGVVRVIRILAGPVPAALLGLGIVSALLYPLSRESFGRITRELEERRKTGSRGGGA